MIEGIIKTPYESIEFVYHGLYGHFEKYVEDVLKFHFMFHVNNSNGMSIMIPHSLLKQCTFIFTTKS